MAYVVDVAVREQTSTASKDGLDTGPEAGGRHTSLDDGVVGHVIVPIHGVGYRDEPKL